MNLNKVMLIGRTGKDPEVNYIKEDVPLARFSVATNESYKTKEGDWRDITEWHNVVAWRNTAKYCENNLKKGALVFVEGKLQTRQWEGQDGTTKYTTEIVADKIRLLEKRADVGLSPMQGSEFPGQERTPATPNETGSTNAATEDNSFDSGQANDDLPF
jgi:single-strand DNA-binding protein